MGLAVRMLYSEHYLKFVADCETWLITQARLANVRLRSPVGCCKHRLHLMAQTFSHVQCHYFHLSENDENRDRVSGECILTEVSLQAHRCGHASDLTDQNVVEECCIVEEILEPLD